MLEIKISPKKVALLLLAIVLFLTAASLAGQYYKDLAAQSEFWTKVINKLDLDLEVNNLPTWYQSSTLLLSSFLLAVITLVKRAEKDIDYRYWAGLSLVFLYLSMDEAVAIHEQLTMPLRTSFHLGGLLYLSWVIPAGILLLLFALLYFKFLFRLPEPTRNLLIASGVIYVAGAIGIEMVGADYLNATHDLPTYVIDFRYVLLTTLEEFLEMAGVLLFIYSLLSYLVPQESGAVSRKAAKDSAASLRVLTPKTMQRL